MSDTYNYNAGSPLGMGGFLNGGFNGCNNIMDLLALVVVGGLFGFGGWGGYGGYGARGLGGQIGADATAATTAALVGQQQVSDRVASTAFGVDQILGQTGGIINQVQRTSDRVQDGFSNLNTYLCSSFNNAAMQAVNNHNNITSQLTDIRFDAQKCCCETQNMLNNKFCELGYRMQADKCDLEQKILAQGETTRAMLRDMETRKLQEELAAAKAQISQDAQTAKILAALNASKCCGTSCCNPCCQPNACSILAQEIVEAGVNRIVNPTTTTTTA